MPKTVAILAALVFVFAFPGVVSADNCSGPSDCLRTAGYTAGITVVSTLVAIGATIWAVTQTSADGKVVSETRELAYYLELTPRSIDVSSGQPASFTVTAYKVEQSGPVVAGNVSISIVPAPDTGLRVNPAGGSGTVSVDVTVGDDAVDGQSSIRVTGSVAGATMVDSVQVTIGSGGYELEVS